LNVLLKPIADGERKIFVNACQPAQVALRVILAAVAGRRNGGMANRGLQISNSPISIEISPLF
jgi:hypothetical protein